jgi:hypothetical protein
MWARFRREIFAAHGPVRDLLSRRETVALLSRQLGWPHLVDLVPIKGPLEARDSASQAHQKSVFDS